MHDTLRLRYTHDGLQYYHEDNSFEWQEVKLTNWDIIKDCTEAQKSLDIVNGPLSRTIWFESEEKQGLFWVAHHLIVDGVSWRILLDDLNAEQLAPKTYSYQSFVEYTKNFDLTKTIEYYQNKEAKPMKKGYDLKIGEEIRQHNIAVSLDHKYTDSFVRKVHASYNTQFNDLLLSLIHI